jgi:secondary thiamine-phosphate synthase enzyme
MKTGRFDVDTPGPLVTNVTDQVRQWFGQERLEGDGLLHLFLPHATAGLALMETGTGSDQDLVAAMERILPRHDRYRHSHGYEVHGRDHLLPVLVSPSLLLAVHGGTLVLGTYQHVVIVDPNRDNNRRTVILSFLQDETLPRPPGNQAPPG